MAKRFNAEAERLLREGKVVLVRTSGNTHRYLIFPKKVCEDGRILCLYFITSSEHFKTLLEELTKSTYVPYKVRKFYSFMVMKSFNVEFRDNMSIGLQLCEMTILEKKFLTYVMEGLKVEGKEDMFLFSSYSSVS